MLSKKYRPTSLDDMYPTVDISAVRALQERVKKEGGVYLFTGVHGSGKCVDKGSIVWYNGGMKRIGTYNSDLPKGHTIELNTEIFSFDSSSREFTTQNTSLLHHDEATKGKSIELEIGYKILCSDIHPIWCEIDGKAGYYTSSQIEASIEKSIWVPIKVKHDGWNKQVYPSIEIELYKWFGNKYKILDKRAITLTDKLFYVVGLLLGDGTLELAKGIGVNKVNFTTVDHELLISIVNTCRTAFGHCEYAPKGKRNTKDWVIDCPELASLIRKLDCTHKSGNKAIPDIILDSPRRAIRYLLRGLFDTDGGVDNRGVISYCSKSEELARDIHNLLLAYGIVGKLSVRRIKIPNTDRYGYYWYIDISGDEARMFRDHIGFGLGRKDAKLKVTTLKEGSTNRKYYPPSMLEVMRKLFLSRKDRGVVDKEHPERKMNAGRYAGARWMHYVRPSELGKHCPSPKKLRHFVKEMKAEKERELTQYYQNDTRWFLVKTCREETDLDLYDFVVDNTHAFIANGFINHNTSIARIIATEYLECTKEVKDRIFDGSDTEGTGYVEWDFTRLGKADDVSLLSDMIREASHPSLYSGKKFAFVLDEFHGAKPETQRKLIKPMEDGDINSMLIIIVTNYPDKLDPAILSGRAIAPLEFRPLGEDWGVKFLMEIAKKEGLGLTKQAAEDLYSSATYTSPRMLLSTLDAYSMSGKSPEEILSQYAVIKDVVTAVRELSMGIKSNMKRENMDMLSKKLYDAIVRLSLSKKTYENVITALGAFYDAQLRNVYKHSSKHSFYDAMRTVSYTLEILSKRPAMYSYLPVDLTRAFFLVAEERARWEEPPEEDSTK